MRALYSFEKLVIATAFSLINKKIWNRLQHAEFYFRVEPQPKMSYLT